MYIYIHENRSRKKVRESFKAQQSFPSRLLHSENGWGVFSLELELECIKTLCCCKLAI